jgi:general secretion pathway protein F
MPNFQYRALTRAGDVMSGSISATTAAQVVERLEDLGLVPIDAIAEQRAPISLMAAAYLNRPRADDITAFTRDLALLLRAGARLYDAVDLLANDEDAGRLRPNLAQIKAALVSGEGFAEAISRHARLFSPMYVALVRVGETSGSLDNVLELLASERARARALQQKLVSALQYPAFVLAAACSVLIFFLLFVLPQFSAVLRDLDAKLDTVASLFLDLSDRLHTHMMAIGVAFAIALVGLWLALRQASVRNGLVSLLSRLPLIDKIFIFYRSGLFCRNLGILLDSGVNLTTALRILVDIMSKTGGMAEWAATSDRVRRGDKLSESLAASSLLPPMAVRMLRLGEETGQLATLAGRIADFYEVKLQQCLDRLVGIAGPVAIIFIGIIVGGLITSVMTALLSVTQAIG